MLTLSSSLSFYIEIEYLVANLNILEYRKYFILNGALKLRVLLVDRMIRVYVVYIFFEILTLVYFTEVKNIILNICDLSGFIKNNKKIYNSRKHKKCYYEDT